MKKCKKIPVIMQMEALECGAASLAMVMAYYKKWVPLEKVREDCGVSRDGSLASNILKAAEKYGLKTRARRLGMIGVKEDVTYPAIIFWNFNHFVVLQGFTDKYALINDPARGRLKVSMEEFDHSFTGVCMEFEPTENFEPGGKPESVLKFAGERLQGSKRMLLFVMIVAALAGLVNVLMPAMSRYFMDAVLDRGDTVAFQGLMTALILLLAFALLAESIHEISLLKVRAKLSVSGNSSFFWHLLKMPVRFFSQRSIGDLANRQALNDTVAETLISKMAPLLINFMLLIIYLIVMVRISLPLALTGIGAVLVNLALARSISRRKVETARINLRDTANVYASTISGIDMIESIKVAGAENSYFEKWSGYVAAENESAVREEKESRILTQLPQLIQAFCNIMILITGIWLIMHSRLTAGMLVAFQAILLQFLSPVGELIGSMQKFQEMRTSMERIEDVMKYEEAPESGVELGDSTDWQKLSGDIELKNVTFGYSRLAKPLLKDFTLHIHPGQKIAVVGMSGCGKSTVSSLIAGLYEPWEGEILYDGKPRSQIPKEVFTGSLLMVAQEAVIFDGTISENIKFWDDSVEDFEMVLAARDAQIHDEILQRPGSYEYQISEGGKNFSGGQRQRFEIARALAGDPSVIILDEATSALDAKTEYEVIKALKARGITCIVVAHRLSTIRDSDLILVMEQGEIKERGTHEELMKLDGLYRKLITTE